MPGSPACPPGRALAASIAGCLAYALVGRSRFAIVSPTSFSAAILTASLASLAVDPGSREAMATALTLMVGLLFLGFSAFRLGALATFISRPVLRGFAFGLAVTITIGQLPKLVGVAVAPGAVWVNLAQALALISRWHGWSLALGLGALVALVGLRRAPHVPAALLVICLGVALGSVADLPAHGIALTGPIGLAMPHPSFPAGLATWARLTQLAAPIALILFAESWGTMRGLALRHGDRLSPTASWPPWASPIACRPACRECRWEQASPQGPPTKPRARRASPRRPRPDWRCSAWWRWPIRSSPGFPSRSWLQWSSPRCPTRSRRLR